jgi:integration host factor subunit alpha
MKTVTKNMLADKLHMDLDLNKAEALEFVESFFEEIKSQLEQGKNIKLSGFGNFMLRDKKARMGRNPKTKEAAEISARRVITFKSGEKLLSRVNEYKDTTDASS